MQFPAEAIVLSTLNILPRIFGVRFSHNAIPLDFGLVSYQFTKEVISKAWKGPLRDLGVDKLTFAALTSVSLLSFAGSFSLVWAFTSFFRAVVVLKVTLEAASRYASYPFFSMNRVKDIRCFTYSSLSAPSPRRVCLDSPLGILILIVSLKVLKSKPFLDTAYGMGGRWVTCPFSHSASLNSWDVGVELILNSRCWQSGVVSIKHLNALFAGRSRSPLVGGKWNLLIPLSLNWWQQKNTRASGVAWG